MKSGLLETLQNILFLSSLECVLGSVLRENSRYEPYPYSWTMSDYICRIKYRSALLSQQFEIDKFDVTTKTSHQTWIGLKNRYGLVKWSDGTQYDEENDSMNKSREQCGYISSTSERIYFTSCKSKYFFYCYGGPSQSPVIFFSWAKNWKDAEKYCKDKYIDLVTLKEDEQFEDLPNDDLMIYYIWTGIHRSEPDGDWKSSTGNPIYENWAEGQPTEDGDCVGISNTDKKMTNLDCDSLFPFYCFTDNLVLVKENKTWEEALEHCRAMELAYPSLQYFNNHRNELISISDQLDQQNVWSRIEEATTNEVWTGLRYLAHKWIWVDGTNVPYQDLPRCPDLGQNCGTLDRDNGTIPWNLRNCNEKRNFLCYRKY